MTVSVAKSSSAFTAFRVLWAVAEIVHLVSFGRWIYEPTGILVLIAAIAVLLKPRSLWRFFVLCAADVIYVFVQMPNTANHILFNGLVNLTIVLVMLRHLPFRGATERTADGIYAEFAPLARVELLTLYAFAVFHKLNTDYFHPEVSCAGVLLRGLADRFPVVPANETTVFLAIWGTLVIETAIPVMLVVRRTRYAGLLLGITFHLMLGVHPHQGLYSFSTMLFVLYTLFLPEDYVARLRAAIAARPRVHSLLASVVARSRRWARVILLAIAIVATAAAAIILLTGIDLRHLRPAVLTIGGLLWLPFALALLVALLWIMRTPGVPLREGSALLSLRWSPGLICLALILANNLSPYLGFHTRRNLSMFSNLRTEGGRSNHLLVRPGTQIAGYQRDLVEVLSSSDPGLQLLADSASLLPHFELRRRLTGRRGPLELRYRHADTLVEVVVPHEDLGTVVPPVHWLGGKVMRFRPVDREGPALCRW